MRHLCIVHAELAVHKQRGHQWETQHGQPHRGRKNQQQAQAQAPVEQGGKFRLAVGGGVFGKVGQQDGGQCRADNAGRQLHQAVGIIHPRHAAHRQIRSKNRVNHQRNLRCGRADNGRHHLF